MTARFSLFSKIYLSTAVAVSALFAGAGWLLQAEAAKALHEGVSEEVRASLGTVDAWLHSRTEHLSTASALLSTMPNVRAAFGTGDRATIQDTAGELWEHTQIGHKDTANAAFVVADPRGEVIASVGGDTPSPLASGQQLPPGLLKLSQGSAFAAWDGAVWQVVVTPVYVDSGPRQALLSILLAAHPLSAETLGELKERTGSDFLLRAAGRTALSTVSAADAAEVVKHPERFAIHPVTLSDGEGKALAELWAFRSFAGMESRIAALRRTILVVWLIAMTVGLALSYLLASRIVRPVKALNQAAQEVSRENYSVRVPEDSHDELGVLSRTFNRMSASIEEARAEQVRSGQIAAVGRLAASIAHDLRNPLAAVMGGAEMIADFDLPPEQMKQTAVHIHKAAGRMEQLLAEVGKVARQEPGRRILCDAGEMVRAAVESQEEKGREKKVTLRQSAGEGLTVRCEKSRVERVIINLIANALEVLPEGGEIAIAASRAGEFVRIEVSDDGPGVPAEIRGKLFQPFVTAGKKNGLGLGLALARQTMLEHGGDLELVTSAKGACFRLRLPAAES